MKRLIQLGGFSREGFQMYPPEQLQRVSELRAKNAEGTITDEELKEFVAILREGRLHAAPVEKAKKAKAAVPDAASLMAKLREQHG